MESQQTHKLNWFDKQALQFEESRIGFMAVFAVSQSALGSIATIYIQKIDNIYLQLICAAITMASNAAFIAQAPAKWCIGLFYSSIVINTIILLFTALL